MPYIQDISLSELEAKLIEMNEKPFRAKQIFQWIWQKNAKNFQQMSNLPENLRNNLAKQFLIRHIDIEKEQISKDSTRKYLLKLYDGQLVEMVLIPSMNRTTVCVSSQVGCALGCKFCATAKIGFQRNLFIDEIYQQVHLANRLSEEYFSHSLSNVVFMGMGEPLLNFQNVNEAINMITSPAGMGMSPSRITLSTAGIADGIKQLALLQPKIGLAISLHCAINEKRTSIMPINKANPLHKLIDGLKNYYQTTGQRITIEYLLLKNFNDSIEDAKQLAIFCRNFPVKINLIDYNRTDSSDFEPTLATSKADFMDFLASKNILVQVRQSKGQDIAAACGQLAKK